MKRETVLNELRDIANVYPTLRGLMNKPLRGQGCTVGEHWATLLQDLPADHFSNVCVAYARLEKELPERLDSLPQVIAAEVKFLASEDQRKLEQYCKYHAPAPRTGKYAVRISDAIRAGELSEAQGQQRIGDLIEWDKGGAKPGWLNEA